MKKYLYNVLVGLDMFGNTLIGGLPDETISAHAGRLRAKGSTWARGLSWALDKIQPQHCADAIEGDELRAEAVLADEEAAEKKENQPLVIDPDSNLPIGSIIQNKDGEYGMIEFRKVTRLSKEEAEKLKKEHKNEASRSAAAGQAGNPQQYSVERGRRVAHSRKYKNILGIYVGLDRYIFGFAIHGCHRSRLFSSSEQPLLFRFGGVVALQVE